MEKKKCAFYDYDKKIKKKIQCKKNLNEEHSYEEYMKHLLALKRLKLLLGLKEKGVQVVKQE